MIPHPSTEAMLAKHGNTRTGREAARDEMRRAIHATADIEAGLAGKSIRCRSSDHARIWVGPHGRSTVVGCQNTGANCICDCHDPKDAP